jgi:tRNA threonylcarbamoyl adenosine modification protein YjeE
METFKTRSVSGTLSLGRKLSQRFSRGDCVALIGDLGAGKTVLARGIVAGLGVEDPRLVSSPTFVLVQEYPASVPVYHIDLYRMADPAAELIDLGLDEMLREGIVLIEWADRAPAALPGKRWEIRACVAGASAREYTVQRLG